MIGTREIADMLGVTREYATDRITKRPDFPKPALALNQKLVRWEESDVLRWIEEQRIRAGRRSVRRSHGSSVATSTGHDAQKSAQA